MTYSNNGLHQVSYTRCIVCNTTSPHVSGAPTEARRDLRQLGWRPERVAEERVHTFPDGETYTQKTNRTRWYCPAHEQMRPTLKKNQQKVATQ